MPLWAGLVAAAWIVAGLFIFAFFRGATIGSRRSRSEIGEDSFSGREAEGRRGHDDISGSHDPHSLRRGDNDSHVTAEDVCPSANIVLTSRSNIRAKRPDNK